MTPLIVRHLGRQDYAPIFAAMQAFTARRTTQDADEIWLLEHPPVYTLGLNGRPEHVLTPQAIPVVKVDRGGQVTYHGPGQLVMYTLFDLKRMGWGIRQLVTALEHSVINLLADDGITAVARHDAPGVYVDGAKIASLGLRVRRGCSYHGLSLNIDMDLAPFSGIHPCGYKGLPITQMRDLGLNGDMAQIAERLLQRLIRELGFGGEITHTNALPH